jgi:hypothetical protein
VEVSHPVNQNPIARAISVVVLGILFAAYMNHDHQKWRRAGRDQFLARETQRFDRVISAERPFGVMAIGTVIGVGFLVGLYELVVFAVSGVLKSLSPPQQIQVNNPGNPFS